MRQFEKYSFSAVEELERKISAMDLKIDTSKNRNVFSKAYTLNGFNIPNALAVHPMEGCDGLADGSPSDLTRRRYERFGAGGAGLIWFEAVAVEESGKANPNQLMLTEKNLEAFKSIVDLIHDSAIDIKGKVNKPVVVAQLTHSGRYSRPVDQSEPIIAYHNPVLNGKMSIDGDYPVITDEELIQLEDRYVHSALLAKEAGFDGVDIKACHRYLISELLSAYDRPGQYGGDFDGRTRFLTNVVKKVKKAVGEDFIVSTRLNIYDGIDYPFGWGVDSEDAAVMDLSEPVKLVGILKELGVSLVNITMGTPYFNPHVNRPYDNGGYIPEEHPLVGVERLINGAGLIQQTYKDMIIVGTGYSWLRNLSVDVAAGTLENGKASIIGYGREAFAYPDYAKDILEKGDMDQDKCCIACGKCTELMRAHTTPGCVIRDREVYTPLYREVCAK